MNEEYMQYLHLIDDKNLIGKQQPNENDLKNFEIWKKRWQKHALKGIIFSSIIVLLIYSFIFAVSMFSETELKDIIILIIFLFIFAFAEYHLMIKKYLNTKTLEMEYCNRGKILDKYMLRRPGSKHGKDYYIIVQVDDNKLKIQSETEYHLVDINETVIVFSIKGHSQAYITKYN